MRVFALFLTHLKRLTASVVVLLALFASQNANATHLMGGDITYDCVGPYQYLVKLTMYRDCNGVGLGTVQDLAISSAQCGVNFNFQTTRTSVTVVTPICVGALDACNSGGGVYGIERHIYEGFVDLQPFALCGTDWRIDYNLYARNNAITSLVNPGSQGMYLYSIIDNTVDICNTSPTFLNDPTPYVCVGQPSAYNHGYSDQDGDSLSFSLVQPRTGNINTFIPFQPGYSTLQPILTNGGSDAVNIDPVTGTITFTANQQQVAVLTVQVEEWRNGVQIGEYIRDIQITVLACSNNYPTATGIDGSATDFTAELCANTTICFDVIGSDADLLNNLSMTWNGGIPGATFTTSGNNPVTGTFCWTPTAAQLGQYLFTVTVEDDACLLNGSNTYGYVITVTEPFENANAGPDLTACGSVTLQGAISSSNVAASWSVVSGSGNFSSASDPTAFVTGLSQGVNVFEWTADYGTCGITTDQVTVINYSPSQQGANAGTDIEVCGPGSATNLNGSAVVFPAVGTWTLISGTGTIVNPNNPNTQVTNLGAGQNRFRWSVDNGPCGGISLDDVFVDVFTPITSWSAGPDQSICTPVSAVQLNGTGVTYPTAGQWNIVSGGGNFTNANSPNSQVVGLPVGVHLYEWVGDNGPCGISRDTVRVEVYDSSTPLASAGADVSVCTPTSSIGLTGSTLNGPASGAWTLISGQGNIQNPTSNNTNVNGLGIGANVFEWTVFNGPCGTSSDQVVITLYDGNEPAANAGANQTLCTPASTTNLSAFSTTAPAVGTWSLVSGSGVIADVNNPNSSVSGLSTGINEFMWTVDNGPCAVSGTSDLVQIIVYDQNAPQANAGANQSICTPANSVNLDGNVATIPATGTWSLVSGPNNPNIVAASNPSTALTGLIVGEYVLRWTIDNGPCSNAISTDDVTIQVFDENNPVANAGPDEVLCSPTSTTILLGSNVIPPAVGVWSLVSGTGTIANVNAPNSAVTGMPVGTHVFQWQVFNGPCANPTTTDQVSISIYDQNTPLADAGPDQDLCTPNTSTNLAGSSYAPPTTASWTQIAGPNTATFANINDPNTQVSGLAVGSYTFRWTVGNGACEGSPSSNDVIINVYDDNAPVANAGVDQNFCSVFSGTLTGNATIGVATGNWSLISGAGSIANPSNASTFVSGLGFGENVFQWTIDNGPCGITTDQVSIFVFNASDAVAGAGPDQSICTPITTAIMNASSYTAPATGNWSLVSGTGTIADPNDPNTVITGLAIGVNVFEWEVNAGLCPNGITNDQVSITVFSGSATPANAGPDQNICDNPASTVLAGNAPTGAAIGTWTVTTGSATFVDDNDPLTAVAGLSVGQNILRWSIDNGSCGISNDFVNIFVYDDANANADAGADQEICTPQSTSTLSGSALIFPATGTWSVVSGTASIVNPTDPNSSITGLSVGTHVFEWSVDNGPCPNGVTTDQVSITVYDDNAPVANAGADQNVCGPLVNVNLTGNTPTAPASGSWQNITGVGSIVDPTNPNSQVTGLTVGIHTFRWQISNGPCSNALTTDEVSINVFDPANPVANAGADIDLCTPATTTNLNGSAFTSPAVGFWTIISGTGAPVDAFDPNTAVTGLTVGTHVFQWNMNNGPCPNGTTIDQVTVNVYDDANAIANAGPNQDICTPLTSATLAGSTVTAPAMGTWTLVSGTGTFANVNDPSTTVSGLTIGANVFEWTVVNGPCSNPSTSDQVTINLFNGSAQQADAGVDQSFCSTTTNTVMAANAPVGVAVGTWNLVQGTAVITDLNDPLTTITGMGVGEIILEWSIDNGACGISSDLVSLLVFDVSNPVASAGIDQNLCSPNFSTNLAGSTTLFPAEGTWTLVSGTGTITDINDPNSSVSGLTVGENVFEWSVSNGPCPNSITTDQVSIFVYDENNLLADAGPDQQICTPSSSVTMAGSTVIFPSLGTWSIVSGTANITSPNNPNTTLTGLTVGTVELEWTVNNGPCANAVSTDRVIIEIFDDANVLSNAGPDQEICLPTNVNLVTLAGSAVTSPAVGTWTLVCGTGAITDINDPTTQVGGLSIGLNCFVWTVSNGPCAQPLSTDTVIIRVYDDANPPANAGPDQELCTPITTATMAGSTPLFPAQGTWSIASGTGTITDVNDPTTTITALGVGVNVFEWTVSNGPCTTPLTTDQVSITIFDGNAQVANAGPNQDLCSDSPSTSLAGNTVVGAATGVWNVASGTAIFADDTNPSTTVNGLSVGENVLYWTIDNGTCGSSVDSVSIFVYDVANAAADAGADQDICTPITSTTLAGNTPTFPATGVWTLVSGSGTIVNPSNPSTVVSNLNVGVNVFEWTVNNGPCSNPITSNQVSIVVFDGNAQVANAGADIDLCSDNPITTVAGNAPIGAATGTWSLAQGVATIVNPSNPTTAVNGLAVGNNILVWTIDNGSCGLSTDSVSIFVYDASNPNADAGVNQDICTPISTSTMAASAVTFPAQGTWTLVSGNGVIANVNDPNSTVSGLTVGANIFQWSVDNGPCANGVTTDLMTINVFNGNAQLADAGIDQNYCTPQDTADLLANSPLGVATGLWTLTQGTGTFDDATNPSTQVSGLTVGENIFTWTIDNGSCGTSSDQVSIFIFDASNQLADAGADQELCTPTSTTTLAGSPVIFPAQGTWSIVSGTANIVDVNDPNTQITGLQIGTVVLSWSVDNGPCNNSPSSDVVSITLFDDTQANADAGIDQDLCSPNFSTSMTANVAAPPAIGTWSLVSGTGVLANANDASSVVSGLSVGENIFEWSVYNGACGTGTTVDTVSIFVYDATSPNANAGTDISICTPNNSVSLAGNSPIFPAQGTWSLVSGAGTITDVNDPNTSVTALPIGTHVFEWTIDNGPCTNGVTSDQVTVFVYDQSNPNANAGTDILLCTPTSVATLAASSITSPAIGTWSVISGNGTFQDLNSPTSVVNDLLIGFNTFVWTVDNGACANGITTDTVDVIVFDNGGVPSNAGPDQSICTPTTSVTMAGSAVTFPEVGVWLTVQGGGTFADINDPLSPVSALPIGENIFVWSVNNGPCPTGVTGDTVSVFVYDQLNPNANAGTDQNFCLPTTSTNFNGSVNTLPAIGTWTLVQGTGVIADSTNANSAVSGLSVGENIFAWTVNNGPCANGVSSDTVSIFIYSDTVTVADAGADFALCTPNTTGNMSASPYVFPATGVWTLVSGSGTITDPTDPNTTITNIGLGINEFMWTVNNGPCAAGLTSDVVQVEVFNAMAPDAAAGLDQQICTPNASVVLAGNTPVGLATGLWTVTQGAPGITFLDATDPQTTVNGLLVGETILTWTIDNGVCGISNDAVSIFVYDENSPAADVGLDIELCTPEDSLFLPGNVPVFPASVTWSVLAGTGLIINPNDPNTLVTGLSYGNNIFAYEIFNGPCAPSVTYDTLIVTLYSDSTAPAFAGIDQQICMPNNFTTLDADVTLPPAVGTWSVVAGSGTFNDVNNPASDVSGLTIGDNIFVWTLDNGPCPTYGITTDTVVVTLFDDNQASANAGIDQEACLPNTTVQMQANSYSYPATGYWTVLSGTAIITDSLNPTTTVSGLVIGSADLLWTIDNGPCPGGLTTDTVQIRLYDPTAPLADAGPNDSLCTPNSSTFLNAATPLAPGNGIWTLVQGTGAIADTTDPNSQVTGLSVGINRFEWFVYNGFCGFGTLTSVDTVDVYVYDDQSPNADAGPDQDICFPANSSITMAANTPTFPAFGTWSSPTASGVITDVNDPLTTVTGLTIGVHQFVWESFNGPCANSITRDTMMVQVFDDNAPNPDAGIDQEICVPTVTNQVTMAANTASFPGYGFWTLLSGTATIIDSTDANTLVTDLIVGTHLLSWTIVNGPCWTRTDTVMIEVFDENQGNAAAGPDQILCSPTSSTTLAGNAIISPAVGTWTILSGSGTLVDANDPLTDLTGLTIGETVLVWDIYNGTCANSQTTDTVVIQVFDSNANPAMAGPDQDYCTPITNPVTMFANNAILPAIGTWVLISGTATIVNANDPFTEVTGLGLGENVFEWQMDNANCGVGQTADQMSIFVYDSTEPAANAGESVTYCQDVSEHMLGAVDSLSTGVGTWSLISGVGSIMNPSDPASLVTDLVEGMHVYMWTVDNGTCGTTMDTMLIYLEDCLTLTIPDAFSPNGDDVNDVFVIDNIESYPQNNFKVFNRWGAKVLDRNAYNNDWDGTSEHSGTWGDELPESTYYYVLELGEGLDSFTGFIYLKR